MTRGRRGAVLPLVCVLLVVLLGAGALAIDLGRMQLTAQEAQGAADAAALGAARQFQMDPTNAASTAPAAAAAVAQANRVAGAAGVAPPAGVEATRYLAASNSHTAGVAWDRATAVRAAVTATSPDVVGAAFLSDDQRQVTRRATAWVANVNGASCLMPMALPHTEVYHLLARGVTNVPNRDGPEYTQLDMRAIGNMGLAERTVVLAAWPTTPTVPFHGWWMPVDFTGRGSPAEVTDWAARRNCANAATRVGQDVAPFRADVSSYPGTVGAGIESLCYLDAGDARCRIAPGSRYIAPRLRWVLTDDVAGSGTTREGIVASRHTSASGGSYPRQRVRGVAVLRLVCYFRNSNDFCGNIENYTPPFGRTTDYPPGTMLVLMTPLQSIDLAPDIVLGDRVGYTQRLVLVR